MKKTILALSLLALGSAGAYAQVRGGISTDGFSVRIGTSDGDRSCRELVRQLQTEKFELERDLRSCQIRPHHGGGSELRRVKNELATTKYELQEANNKIYQLKAELRSLQARVNPHRGGHFDLASSIKACSGIKFSSDAKKCSGLASKYRIKADIISACTKINFSSDAVKCIENVGKYHGTVKQVAACTKIRFSSDAAKCVGEAAKGKVSGRVVEACIQSTSFSRDQVSCVTGASSTVRY